MLASAAMSAAGSAYGGLQANAQGKYEAKLAQRNAVAETNAARDSIEIGQGERRQYWREVAQAKGSQIASMAANGIDVDFGSGARVQADTQLLAYEDAENLNRNINNRTQGHVINAANYVEQAKARKASGKAAMISGFIEGAGSLMSGVSQMKAMKAKTGTSRAKN